MVSSQARGSPHWPGKLATLTIPKVDTYRVLQELPLPPTLCGSVNRWGAGGDAGRGSMGAKIEGTSTLWGTEPPSLAEMLFHLQSQQGRTLSLFVKLF